MSLTLPTAYSNSSKLGNIQENWIVQLGYDDEGANDWTGIALSDTTVGGVFYHGSITNKPSIRSSINLSNSTAKTGNVSLSVVNFQYKGDDFSAELFLGTRKYINRNVKIYSQLNGETALANCLQIYQGRLIDVSHDDTSVSLQLTEQRPWDFISIPQDADKSTAGKIHTPLSYGDFTKNTNSTYASPQYIDPTNLKYRPIPFNNNRSGDDYFISHKTGTQRPNPEIATYDKSLKTMLPLEEMINDSKTTTVTEDGVECSYAKRPNIRGFKQTGIAVEEVYMDGYTGNSGGNVPWTNMSNAIDKDTANVASYTTYTHGSYVHNVDHGNNLRINLERPDGTIVQGTAKVKYNLNVTLPSSYHNTDHITLRVKIIDSNGDNSYTDYTYSASSGTYVATSPAALNNTDKTVTITYDSDDSFPDYVDFYVQVFSNNQNNSGSAYWVKWLLEAQEFTVTTQMKSDEEEPEEVLFIGADGIVNSWASAAISYGHEAHRDMLIRYAGYTTTEPANWSALNTDRAIPTWKIRWWELDPVELKKVLEQLQYEFGFIFKLRADGTGSYIHILQTSELSATQTFTKNDITNLKINNTPFSDLLTKMEINYEKHPAENRYLSSVTSSNSTARTNYNIQAKENIKEVNLDMNVGTPNASGQTDGNADFYSYYDNIFGDIKKIINCDIVNSAKGYSLETGDIVQFSNTAGDMPVDPFGDNWADFYMITNLNRSPGKVSITAREVG